jgi:dipeptidyl aminopeptidase/acylaminoacyl peptidase
MKRPRALGPILLVLSLAARAEPPPPPPLAAFAARPALEDLAVSPDGRYLAAVQSFGRKTYVGLLDRDLGPRASWTALVGEPPNWRLRYCRFTALSHLVCGLRGMLRDGERTYAAGELVGLDIDGGGLRVLYSAVIEPDAAVQNQVIDWNPGPADTVLIEGPAPRPRFSARELLRFHMVNPREDAGAYPAVFALNVRSGRRELVENAHPPIRHFITDGHGDVRLGIGLAGREQSYWARLQGESRWRELARFPAFSREAALRPVAVSDLDSNSVYAIGDAGGRNGMWLVDLKGETPPSLVFEHAEVDAAPPLLTDRGRLLGFYYEAERPHILYVDEGERGFLASIDKLLPGAFNFITDSSHGRGIVVLRSISDVDEGSYFLASASSPQLQRLGRANPELDPAALAPLTPYRYTARDGANVPGYLALPQGIAPEQLPLVVMPHGGPLQRDSWRYFFLRAFLASRGYAVLSANYRGSTGYGREWQYSAHEDWGGLSYNDVVDGVAPLVAAGIADPKRVALVGWSFGGYLAELAAVRGESAFRCAISIAGISDLARFLDEAEGLPEAELLRAEIGSDPARLAANSPITRAGELAMPLLLVHGDHDAQVQVQQSVRMDELLTHQKRPHRYVQIRGGDHQFSTVSDRTTLLDEVESFLRGCLPP